MEQRSEARIPVLTDVIVEVLGDKPYSLLAEVVDISSHGMRLATTVPLALDSALRIVVDGDQYLGEVTHCGREGGTCYVGVSLFNVIRNVEELTKRMNRLLLAR